MKNRKIPAHNKQAVIVEGLRTPYCKANGVFRTLPAYELGKIVVRELLERTELPANEVDEVIFGNIGQPPEAINIARVIALKAGIADTVPAFTVQRNCGSGLQAIVSAYYQIVNGDADTVIAGGVESMSHYPLLFPHTFGEWYRGYRAARTLPAKLNQLRRFKLEHLRPVVSLQLALRDYICEMHMGQTAELLARRQRISRREQDEYALLSHQRATHATAAGYFQEETVAVYVPPDYQAVIEEDDGIRKKQTLEELGALKPVFDPKFGTITAGNASQITDGAAVLLMMSEKRAKTLGMEPLGYIRSFDFAGVAPALMGIAPTYATAQALRRGSMVFKDIGLMELNEAFAAVVIANERLFADKKFIQETFRQGDLLSPINREKLNVNGGAIALGHPVGSSAVRLVLTLLKEMGRRNVETGLATMCISGGQGGAIILERR